MHSRYILCKVRGPETVSLSSFIQKSCSGQFQKIQGKTTVSLLIKVAGKKRVQDAYKPLRLRILIKVFEKETLALSSREFCKSFKNSFHVVST